MEKLGNHTFGFHFTSCEKTVKGFDNLKSRKVSQETDISVKIAKENVDSKFLISCIMILITRCHALLFPLV